jgi:uncharacterized protein YjbI with pentapeptide repeats
MFRLTSIESFMDHVTNFHTLSLAIVEDVTMPNALLPDMTDATFLRCDFRGVTMPDNIENGLFVDCRLAGLSFNRASLFNTRFIRCDFSKSQFLKCDLSAAQFEECRLTTTEFFGCDLEGTDVEKTDPLQ